MRKIFLGLCLHACVLMPISAATYEDVLNDSVKYILANINHGGIAKGALIASPSTSAPNYFYHWTRDAALTYEALFQLHEKTADKALQAQIRQKTLDWIDFEIRAQNNATNAVGNLGEPRYNVDGSVNTDPWGRPQNDGPADRALTMSEWALYFLKNGERSLVLDRLYRADLPASKIIKKDLEYVSYHWQDESVDLWEEIRGSHFFTLSMQRRALLKGAELADALDDGGAATWYRSQADAIKNRLGDFIDSSKNYIVTTLDKTSGVQKASNLDIAVLIAANHALFDGDEFMADNKSHFLDTARALESKFHDLYAINRGNTDANVGVAFGRYPEDIYDGNTFTGGNPWFLATHAAAEFYCRYAKLINLDGKNTAQAQALHDKALTFLNRSLTHRNQQSGEMTEEFSRENGYLVGASHLTWSYASFITAYISCIY